MSEIHEIADGIYRISNFGTQAPVEFTQFLIKDENPVLYHTGPRGLFPETLEAVKKVMDPADLRYISWSHLESDEVQGPERIPRRCSEGGACRRVHRRLNRYQRLPGPPCQGHVR